MKEFTISWVQHSISKTYARQFFQGSLQFQIWTYLREIRHSERLLREQNEPGDSSLNPKPYAHETFVVNPIQPKCVSFQGFPPQQKSPELPEVPGVFLQFFQFGPFCAAKLGPKTAKTWTFTAYPALLKNTPPEEILHHLESRNPLNNGSLSTGEFAGFLKHQQYFPISIRINIQNPPQRMYFFPNHKKFDSGCPTFKLCRLELGNLFYIRYLWFVWGSWEKYKISMVVKWWFTMVESKKITKKTNTRYQYQPKKAVLFVEKTLQVLSFTHASENLMLSAAVLGE